MHYTRLMLELRLFTWLRVLIWMLAFALPLQVQAQAQASMPGCGPAQDQPSRMHHHRATQLQAPLLQTRHQPASDAATGDHLLHHAEDSASGHQHAPHQCSACAACCIGLALPSAALRLTALAGHDVQLSAPEPASLNVARTLLERPPRSSRA